MAELRELVEAVARPSLPYLRLRVWNPVGAAARGLAPFVVLFSSFFLIVREAALHPDGPLGWALDPAIGPLATLGAFAVIFAALYARTQRLRRLMLENGRGILELSAHGPEAAEALYDSLARQARSHQPHHALFVGNLGVVLSVSGRLDEGRALLAEALRSRWLTQGQPLAAGGYFAAWLARSFALQGDLRTAQAWRGVASELQAPGRRAMLLMVDAIILLRSGHASAAADAIAAGWMGAEGELLAHDRRALRALHAFALGHVPGRESEVESALAALWPPSPSSLSYLGTAWPEMRSFVATRAG